MSLDRYHLTKRAGGWRLERAGSNRPIVSAETKMEAMQRMRRYMATHDGSVRIHKMNGQIQEERTYPRSRDPGSAG
jgi:hypothetical protein